mmetsp:Transcript_42861/g.127002  ORF Transcript_42861/g.127002 Transcript_42861/m.127002 type:complete len:317 (+) Transcript_42861:1012-1962(+)
MTGVCFFRMLRRPSTNFTVVSNSSTFACWSSAVMVSSALVLILSRLCICCRVPRIAGGVMISRASVLSSGSESFRWRNTAIVVRRSSAPARANSWGLGPITAKMGIMWNCVAQCVTMCSASSTLPRPVVPSITTTPPRAKGLPGGAWCLGPVGLMVCSLWCSAGLKTPPSISMTLTMPAHWRRPQSIWTPAFVTCALEKAFEAFTVAFAGAEFSDSASAFRASDQGKRIFRAGVRPIVSSVSSFMMGWKIGIGCVLPFTLMAGSALKRTSSVDFLLVSSSQRMPSGGALLISRAERLTQSPRTVYSMRFALPQTPQ